MATSEDERAAQIAALTLAVRKVIVDTVLLFDNLAHQLGINPTDMQCLNIIDFDGPVTPGRLAELTGLTTGAITTVLDRLEARGFTRRTRDPYDRRKILVEQVAPAHAGAFQAIDENWLELCSKYTNAELATVLAFITDMHQKNQERLPMIKKLRQQEKREGEDE